MKKLFILLLLIAFLVSTNTLLAFAEDSDEPEPGNEPGPGAEAPESVYARYANAVHSGDVNTIKKLVYSVSLILWEKNGRQMLAMTKNTIPQNPSLVSKKPFQEMQYNYMILNYTGVMQSGVMKNGEVKMIVENSEWKVYQEIWR